MKNPASEYSTSSSEELKKFHSDRNIEASRSIMRMIIVMCSVWVVVLFYLQIYPAMFLTVTCLFTYILCYYLHSIEQHLTARLIFFTSSNILLFVTSILVGTSMNIDLIMMSGVGLIFLVFNYANDKTWILYCFVLVLINVFTQWCFNLYDVAPLISIPSKVMDSLALLSIMTAFVILFIVLIKFMRIFEIFEDTIFDLTETKMQLIHAEKMASLGQLTAGVAHELNNPINVINASLVGVERNLLKSYELIDEYEQAGIGEGKSINQERIDILSEEVNSEATRKLVFDVIGDVKIGAKRTRDIVSSLMKFSRCESEEKFLLNIIESINDSLLLAKHVIKPSIKIEKYFDDGIEKVSCFGFEMNQVFMNLILNAEQAISEKGTITISVQNLKDVVSISVKDDGCGMDEKTRRQIFNPFFTTKPVGKGIGLGLSISYGIVERNGGAITVKSERGLGSEFSIHLPKNK